MIGGMEEDINAMHKDLIERIEQDSHLGRTKNKSFQL